MVSDNQFLFFLNSIDPIINAISFLFVPWYMGAVVGPITYLVVGTYMLFGRLYCNYCAKLFQSIVSYVATLKIYISLSPFILRTSLVCHSLYVKIIMCL